MLEADRVQQSAQLECLSKHSQKPLPPPCAGLYVPTRRTLYFAFPSSHHDNVPMCTCDFTVEASIDTLEWDGLQEAAVPGKTPANEAGFINNAFGSAPDSAAAYLQTGTAEFRKLHRSTL